MLNLAVLTLSDFLLQKDVFEIPAVDLGQLTKVKVTHDGAGPGSGWLLDKVIIRDTPESCFYYLFECGQWLDEGAEGKKVEVILNLTDIVQESPPKDEKDDKQYKGI